MKRSLVLLFCCFEMSGGTVTCQTLVQDIFGRSLNSRGITLVDWDGYMANPLIKLYVLPPSNAVLPGSLTLSADGERLYFGNPGDVSASGPSAVISFPAGTNEVPLGMSIFPAHDDPDGNYALTLVFTDANNVRETNTVPIRVIDEDTHRTNDFVVTVNFDRDTTGFFTNTTARAIVRQPRLAGLR